MSEWKEFDGSDEQIAEMRSHKVGYILRFKDGKESGLSNDYFIHDIEKLFCIATHYLLCNPHPLADMICQQARTGQPVWVRVPYDEGLKPWKQIGHYQNNYQGFRVYETTTPDWNIPGAEYSFTEFKEEV